MTQYLFDLIISFSYFMLVPSIIILRNSKNLELMYIEISLGCVLIVKLI